MEPVVFAARLPWMAVLFAAPWNDDSLEFGEKNNQYYLRERAPGAFKLLETNGIVYTVSAEQFSSDPRLGMCGDEFIARQPVRILAEEQVECIYTRLCATPVLKMLRFEDDEIKQPI